MHDIKMAKWDNGGGITLTLTHPYSPDQLKIISLDFADVERLHSLLEDYRNAPNPFKIIEGPEPETCRHDCAFRDRNQFGQWECNNCPRIWSAPDGGRVMQPSEITRLILEKKTTQDCSNATSHHTGNVCNARAILILATGDRLYDQCKGCGAVRRSRCAFCPESADTMINGVTACIPCCAEEERKETAQYEAQKLQPEEAG